MKVSKFFVLGEQAQQRITFFCLSTSRRFSPKRLRGYLDDATRYEHQARCGDGPLPAKGVRDGARDQAPPGGDEVERRHDHPLAEKRGHKRSQAVTSGHKRPQAVTSTSVTDKSG